MYKDYFGFSDSPFSISPDPHFLFMSEVHRDALAHLLYGVENEGGIILLTGEVGTGKTTLCRCLLDQLPHQTRIAYVYNPPSDTRDLLMGVCREFGLEVSPDAARESILERLSAFLVRCADEGSKAVLIVDEGQNLSVEVLEQLRLLTNFETNQKKLLQILLLGQPELHRKLSLPLLRQFAQRVTARFVLEPLCRKEIRRYLQHRLRLAGGDPELFPSSLMKPLYRLSKGVPRIINLICDRALLGAYAEGARRVNRRILRHAAAEIFSATFEPRGSKLPLRMMIFAAVLSSVFVGLGAFRIHRQPLHPEDLGVVSGAVSLAQAQPKLSISGSLESAQRALLMQWVPDASPDSEEPFCRQVLAYGLECLEFQGNLGGVLRYNRPAILRFFDEQGTFQYALMTGYRGDSVALYAQGGEYRMEVSALQNRWDGYFQTLWRRPALYQRPLNPGELSPLVPWLDRSLAAIMRGASLKPRGDEQYSFDLVERVRKFQASRQLHADGIVGKRTLMALNHALDPAIPALRMEN